MKKIIATKSIIYSLLAVLLMVSMTACTKYSFMPMDEKLVGKWQFENVTYRSSTWSRADNITHEYRNWEYEFKLNGDFIMRNLSSSQEFNGRWNLSSITAGVEEPETIYLIHISVLNGSSTDIDQYVWEISSLGSRRLKASESWGNESWNYDLIRM